ncbi:acetolactate synthase-1/2/3 large subunit [Caballeronia udeis]|uniref:Acetolactate synthase-1/2/3 large subunit n=1 Tax=Caballeronia udeis TaxID=1232866 RepID=A0ABW8MXV9_9BURK
MQRSLSAPRTGGQILIDQLVIHGIQQVFCVPGESYLAALDALHDAPIDVTVCRQEGGAAMMAEAHGKLSGRPGICFVTRGPGATNASAGVHIAQQDSTPMILFVGQVERGALGRDAFQEVDYAATFGTLAKWATEISDPARIPEIVLRAFHVATSGRPGPVVIALPEDMLTQTANAQDPRPYTPVEISVGEATLTEFDAQLRRAERPVAIVGGSGWDAKAVADFVHFSERYELPVAVSYRRQMLFPATHPNFIGDIGFGPNPKLVERIANADLVLLVGTRLSEAASQGYTLLQIPTPVQKVIHVHADTNELGRMYQPTLAINATPKSFASAVADLPGVVPAPWSALTHEAHAEYKKWSDLGEIRLPGRLQMARVMEFLKAKLPSDAVICNGAGNYSIWVHRFFPFTQFATQLAPTCGSMGYGVPAAVAAKRVHPDKTVIAFAGDGCFLMHGQEFATAVQYELPIIVVVIDNSMYGTIRMHQEKNYPGRISATELRNPDFAAYANAFGGYGERVETAEEFEKSWDRAVASGKPAILHCLIDPEAITPTATLSALRDAALSAGK